MRNKLYKIATAALALAITLTLSCSGDSGGGGGGGNDRSIKKEKITGISQKGPFSDGASVRIYELDANFEETKNFFDGTTDGNGNFEIQIKNGKLASPYISIVVSGKYVSEVSGQPSTDQITLKSVADVSGKSNVNINVLTHLEHDKVLKLAKSGTEFDVAKKETQRQVLNALGISGSVAQNSEDISLFGSSPSDSALLIVSILLQGNRTTGAVSDLLDKISNDINSSGALSNSVKAEVANGLAGLNMDEVRDNILNLAPSAKVPSSDDIKNVVAGIDSPPLPGSSSSVPSSSSVAPSSSSSVPPQTGITYGPPIAYMGETYKTVVIGEQTWFQRNLNYAFGGSKCYGEGDKVMVEEELVTLSNAQVQENCAKYGRLYDFATANTVCPANWHLPSMADWQALATVVGGFETAGKKLKATSGWANSGNGTDDYGFAAMPGGTYPSKICSHEEDEYGNEKEDCALYYSSAGNIGAWWSSSDNIVILQSGYDGAGAMTPENQNFFSEGFISVRCLKD
ncbi:hypothetical protein R83H12_02341 [Fibrobacteria bacterium R8-3-H12]